MPKEGNEKHYKTNAKATFLHPGGDLASSETHRAGPSATVDGQCASTVLHLTFNSRNQRIYYKTNGFSMILAPHVDILNYLRRVGGGSVTFMLTFPACLCCHVQFVFELCRPTGVSKTIVKPTKNQHFRAGSDIGATRSDFGGSPLAFCSSKCCAYPPHRP